MIDKWLSDRDSNFWFSRFSIENWFLIYLGVIIFIDVDRFRSNFEFLERDPKLFLWKNIWGLLEYPQGWVKQTVFSSFAIQLQLYSLTYFAPKKSIFHLRRYSTTDDWVYDQHCMENVNSVFDCINLQNVVFGHNWASVTNRQRTILSLHQTNPIKILIINK